MTDEEDEVPIVRMIKTLYSDFGNGNANCCRSDLSPGKGRIPNFVGFSLTKERHTRLMCVRGEAAALIPVASIAVNQEFGRIKQQGGLDSLELPNRYCCRVDCDSHRRCGVGSHQSPGECPRGNRTPGCAGAHVGSALRGWERPIRLEGARTHPAHGRIDSIQLGPTRDVGLSVHHCSWKPTNRDEAVWHGANCSRQCRRRRRP